MADPATTAIVTGAASGIGRSIAERVARLGYQVVAVDRDRVALEAFVERLPTDRRRAFVADVADAESWRGLADKLVDEQQNVGLLVQAAGALLAGRLADCEPREIERLVRVNLTSVLLGASTIGPLMASSAESGEPAPLPRGVLNVASIFAAVAPPGFAVYNATKAGVVAATETLRAEWAPLGLTATAVLPGVTKTGLFDRAVYPNDTWRSIVAKRVAACELTADRVAEDAIAAYRRGRVVAPIGRRPTRYHWLKRLLPGHLLGRVAAQAARELPE